MCTVSAKMRKPENDEAKKNDEATPSRWAAVPWKETLVVLFILGIIVACVTILFMQLVPFSKRAEQVRLCDRKMFMSA
jgi:hypothetical protein